MAKLTISLVESDKVIEKKILKAIKEELDNRMQKIATQITKDLRNTLKEAIKRQPEYLSLDSGQLAADFGFRDGKYRIDAIIDFWIANIVVKEETSKIKGDKISTGIQISIMSDNFEEVLNLPEASVVTNKGQVLPWLNWLLKLGSENIIQDYSIEYGPIKRSRSGAAIMVSNPGFHWSVPSKYSGVATDNFITRAIKNYQDRIEKSIEDTTKKEFK